MSLQLETPPARERVKRATIAPRGVESPTSTPRAMGVFFWLVAHAPWFVRWMQPVATRLVPLVSGTVRGQTRRNAMRIFGRVLAPAEQLAFSRSVVEHFYEFLFDVGRSSRESVESVLARIERVEGEAEYLAVRRNGRGAVLVTAHMGSFEVGLAALSRVERRVHVVFKRDATQKFESMRATLRRRLGILEAPIDDGLSTWMDLRDALRQGDVVVMQADRAMPGQKSAVVPFLHGQLRVPTGGVRLARLTGCAIVPVFTIRLASGRLVVHLLPAIEPGQGENVPDSSDPAVVAVAKAIESMVARYPTQWLVLGAAFEEDAGNA